MVVSRCLGIGPPSGILSLGRYFCWPELRRRDRNMKCIVGLFCVLAYNLENMGVYRTRMIVYSRCIIVANVAVEVELDQSGDTPED